MLFLLTLSRLQVAFLKPMRLLTSHRLFHLLFFDEGSFARMMQSQGFEQIAIELAPLVAVANATTGLRGSTQKHQGQSSTPLVVRSLFKKSQSSRMAWAPRLFTSEREGAL